MCIFSRFRSRHILHLSKSLQVYFKKGCYVCGFSQPMHHNIAFCSLFVFLFKPTQLLVVCSLSFIKTWLSFVINSYRLEGSGTLRVSDTADWVSERDKVSERHGAPFHTVVQLRDGAAVSHDTSGVAELREKHNCHNAGLATQTRRLLFFFFI